MNSLKPIEALKVGARMRGGRYGAAWIGPPQKREAKVCGVVGYVVIDAYGLSSFFPWENCRHTE